MAQLYTYTVNFYDGNGDTSTIIYNNSLTKTFRRNAEFTGIIDQTIEGSFDLIGNDFDKAIAGFLSQGTLEIKVYLSTVQIFDFFGYDLCDLDYKQKKCTIKNFSGPWVSNQFVKYWNKEFIKSYGDAILYNTIGDKITDHASSLIDFIDDSWNLINIQEVFDSTDYWYSTGLSTIDFDDLRIAAMCDCLDAAKTSVKGGGRRTLTMLKLFKAICTMFNITLKIDSSQVYFAKASDLISNTLDLTAELTNIKTRNYDLKKMYSEEVIKFSDNNSINDDTDCVNTAIKYTYSGETIEHNISDFTTLWTFSDDSSGGWFIGVVQSPSEILDPETGYVSSAVKPNADLLPANLLNTYYRDWINTDKGFFSVCGNPSGVTPTYFKPFIEIPDIKTKIADPSVFYDSVLLELSGTDERIGLVMEQRTELYSNITTFKCYEFKNEIDV